jgi:hypothetical protein
MKKKIKISLLALTILVAACKGNPSGTAADSTVKTDTTLTDTAAANGAGSAGGVGSPTATDSSPGAGIKGKSHIDSTK